MHPVTTIDHLIHKTTAFLENEASRYTCRQLAKQAVACLTEVVGSDHPYTKMVEEAAYKGEKRSLSSARGVLVATKLQLDNEFHLAGDRNGSASNWRQLSGHLAS